MPEAEDEDRTRAESVRFWLILDPGQPTQNIVELHGNRVVIGRGRDCDLVLDDPAVSRQHAVISVRTGVPLVIEDLGSANGTFVNGKKIQAPLGFAGPAAKPSTELRGGEWIRLGDSIALVSLIPPPANLQFTADPDTA
jgi:pSer/pThr/pTyr-binding forkhead associated (FHA) protein